MAEIKNLEEALAKIETLNAEKTELAKENANLKADLKEMNQVLAEVRQTKISGGSAVTFEHKKATYEVCAAKFIWNKVEVTAEEVAANTELQAELIKAECGFIVKK